MVAYKRVFRWTEATTLHSKLLRTRGSFLLSIMLSQCSPRGGDVAQLVTASDCHAADAGLIPQSGTGSFS